jgi:hypothetical protein
MEDWVHRHQLFAAGISVALVFGAASPALAKPGAGPKADKPAKEAKPPKVKPGGVNGGGRTAERGHFSVEVRDDRLAKGHFNYTSRDGKLNVRCRGFDSYSPIVYIQPGPPAAHVTAQCVAKAPKQARTPISLDATFVDNGRRGDEAHITLTRPDGTTVSDNGVIRGSIQVRY